MKVTLSPAVSQFLVPRFIGAKKGRMDASTTNQTETLPSVLAVNPLLLRVRWHCMSPLPFARASPASHFQHPLTFCQSVPQKFSFG
jgi:hypothetical protein